MRLISHVILNVLYNKQIVFIDCFTISFYAKRHKKKVFHGQADCNTADKKVFHGHSGKTAVTISAFLKYTEWFCAINKSYPQIVYLLFCGSKVCCAGRIVHLWVGRWVGWGVLGWQIPPLPLPADGQMGGGRRRGRRWPSSSLPRSSSS